MEGHGREIAKELAQAVGLGILVAALCNLFEQGFGLRFDNGQLEKHGRIKHGIGLFLIGKYPLCFAGTYAGPTFNSFGRRHTAILMVAALQRSYIWASEPLRHEIGLQDAR